MSSTDVHIFIEQQSPLKTHCLLSLLLWNWFFFWIYAIVLFQKLCLF